MEAVWPTVEGRQERSTEIAIELGSEERPLLVRITSRHLNPNTGDVGGRHGYLLFSKEGTVLIDPTEPSPDMRERFDALAAAGGAGPMATVLTSSWHERHAYRMRERFGAPVWLPRAGVAEKEGEPDHLYDDRSALPGGLRAVTIDDRFAGDTVLCWTAGSGERVLFGGDVLIGGSGAPGHWRREAGMHLYMFGARDEERFLKSFRPLLDEPVDLVCSGHGQPTPFRDDPAGTLRRLINEGMFHPPLPSGLGTGRSLTLPA
jgi:glyoxylase-like metal-dependent hydrolase (beta-lactamase superfamily II)